MIVQERIMPNQMKKSQNLMQSKMIRTRQTPMQTSSINTSMTQMTIRMVQSTSIWLMSCRRRMLRSPSKSSSSRFPMARD